MKIAVIPARGGSKRIPRKNIKEFFGKPMLAWSIEAAMSSNLFDQIIVSTDDQEIAKVAESLGANVPFIRPEKISDDFATTTDVIAHAVEWMIEENYSVEAVCCIYATAPFVRFSDLQESYKIFNSGNWEYVFTATDFAAPIFRSFKKNQENGLEMLYPQFFDTRSQDLPEALHDAGQFYWGIPSAWLDGKRIFDQHSTPLIIPRFRVQDIDTDEDWIRAELMAKSMLKK
jgi:N-acylneuraminate cytidylyltransferase